MKSLISYPKHALSTFLVFFVFLMIAEAQDYSQVVREKGLVMQRENDETNTLGAGMINFFHRVDDVENPDDNYNFMFMRATKENQGNNCIITQDGLLIVDHEDLCHRVNLPPDLPSTVKLYVNGDAVQSSGNLSWSIASDERLKKNVNPLTNSLDALREVEFVEFEYNGLAKTPTNKKYYGVLAQQVGQVLPSTVNTFSKQLHPTDKKNTELLMFNANDLIYTGLNAIKELATIDKEQHENLLEELRREQNQNEALEDRVEELENKLNQLLTSLEASNDLNTTRGKLHPNVPNPLSHSTLIKYELSQIADRASIQIQDIHGRTLKDITLPTYIKSGSVAFDAIQAGLTNGTYIYTLLINGQPVDSQQMIFVAK